MFPLKPKICKLSNIHVLKYIILYWFMITKAIVSKYIVFELPYKKQ